jgi:uncharacterized Ntn-hydrolase superfamily protein
MTFSIVARDPETLALGVAVSTGIPAVGSMVPHVEVEVGAIATQAHTNIMYGVEGMRLLKSGVSPQTALDAMLAKDPLREVRQVTIIDVQGRTAGFTGKETDQWNGHIVLRDHAVAGNLIASGRVIESMSETFQTENGSLAHRLLKALEAGQETGGDRRGRMSAALLVADRRWKSENRPILDLRVDAHLNPVKELRRIYDISRNYFQVPE